MVDGPDRLEEFQPPPPGHLFVEQDYAIGLTLEQHQGVVAVRRGLDGKALLFEEEDVRRETLDLVVHPQNALGSGHA